MTASDTKVANGVARHLEPERFQSFAFGELLECPPWQQGVCFHPECAQQFAPRRDWQIYCSTRCERAGTAEMRKWGHRMALPLLTWRMGKYEKHDDAVRDLTRASRRYVSQVQSAWLAERQARGSEAARDGT